MKSKGYQKYLLKEKITKYLIILSQLLILVFLIILWQTLANNRMSEKLMFQVG